MRRRGGRRAAPPVLLTTLLLALVQLLDAQTLLASIYATEPRRVLSAQPAGAAPGCLRCIVAASGRLLCWRSFFGGNAFVQAPPAGVGATRFVSVHAAPDRLVALLDNGGVAVAFFASPGCPSDGAAAVWGYLPGPFVELVGSDATLDQCAIRGLDGNVVCWAWSANPPSGVPTLPASGGFANLTGAVVPSALCGQSCATSGGPFRGLVMLSTTPLDESAFPMTISGVCAIRAADSFPFCVITQGPPGFSSSLLPDFLPLMAFAGLPVARIRSAVGEMSDPYAGYEYGSFLAAIPFAPSPASVTLGISYYGDSNAGIFSVGPVATVPIVGFTSTLLQSMSPSLNLLSIADMIERPAQFPLFFTVQGQVCGGAGPSGTARDSAPSWIPNCDNSGYVAGASSDFQNLCFLTVASTVECWVQMFAGDPQWFLDTTPFAPAAPVQPSAFAGMRGVDTVCMLLPFTRGTNSTAPATQTAVVCFGAPSAVQWALPTVATQLAAPTAASRVLAAGSTTVCGLFPQATPANTLLAQCWGDCSAGAGTQCSGLPASSNASAVTTGVTHSCLIDGASRMLSCFGLLPGAVTPPSSLPVLAAAAADSLTCSILALNSSLYCFGAASSVALAAASAAGQALRGTAAAAVSATDGATFFIVAGPFQAVVAGSAFVCALQRTSGLPLCVGVNSSAQLLAPVVPLSSLACGEAHCCGISQATASALCWGSDSAGQVSGVLAYAASGTAFTRLAATLAGSCGLTSAGFVRCWGALALFVDSVASPSSALPVGVNSTLSVGLPGGSDAACLATGAGSSCATLAGAIAAMGATGAVRVINIYANSQSASIALPPTLVPGLAIRGVPLPGGSLPVVSFMGAALGGYLVSLASSDVVVSNLVLDGAAVSGCMAAVSSSGLYNYFQNVTLQNLRCSVAAIVSTLATATLANLFSSVPADTLLLQNVAFANVSAPIFVRIWGQPAVALVNVSASAPVSAAVFLVVTEAQRVNVSGLALAGFSAPPLAVLPASGQAPVKPCGVGVSATNTLAFVMSTSSFSNMSGGSLASVVCVDGSLALASLISVSSTTVFSSSAAGPGAALHIVAAPNASVVVQSCTFSRVAATAAGAAGGALFILNADTVALVNVSATQVSSLGDGGGLAIVSVRVLGVSGTKVSASSSSAGRGGGLFVSDFASAILASSMFTGCRTQGGSGGASAFVCGAGSAIRGMQLACYASLSGGSFSNSSAPAAFGGALYAASVAPTSAMSLSLTGVSVSGCSAGLGGGGLAFDGGLVLASQQLTMLSSVFAGNSAAGSGGAVRVVFTSVAQAFVSVILTLSSFSRNAATVSGGALFTSMANVLLQSSTFANNSAPSGGATAARNSFLSVASSAFDSNAASVSGGAIAVSTCVLGGLLTTWAPSNLAPASPAVPWPLAAVASPAAAGTVFINNSAGSAGGAIYSSGCSLGLAFATLLLNSASSGGGVFVDSPSVSDSISLGPLVAFANSATGPGGGALTVSLSAGSATVCAWPAGVEAFAYAGWLLQAWTASAATAQQRFTTSTFFLSPAWAALGNQLAALAVSLEPAFSPAANATSWTLSAGACAQPAGSYVTQNTSVVLNTTIAVAVMTTFSQVGSGASLACNKTVTVSYSTAVLAADVPASTALPFACIFGGNAATAAAGLGGDALFTQSATGSSAAQWTSSLSVGSLAGAGGGSAVFSGVDAVVLLGLAFNGSMAGSAARGSGGVGGSTGGALMVQQPKSLALSSSSFSGCAASVGGALWLQPRTNVAAAALTLNGLSFSANAAFFGGADVFSDAAAPPLCTACISANSSAASFYGSASATGPRSAKLLSSSFLRAFGSVSSALVVVGSVAVAQPLLQVVLLDGLGQLVASDNSSSCVVSGVRNDTGGVLSLGFANIYTAQSGIVSVFPFAVENGPGLAALLTVACTTAGVGSSPALALPVLALALGTSPVTVAWSDASLAAAPVYFLSSTTSLLAPPSAPVAVKLVDLTGSTIAAVSVRCALSIATAVDGAGAAAAAALVGPGNTANTVAGVASFSPSLLANSNTSVQLSASCTWISGDIVSVAAPLPSRTYSISLMWASADGSCACAAPGGNATAPCSAVCAQAWLLGGTSFGGGALVVTAAGSQWAVSSSGVASRLQATLANTSALGATSALPSSLNAATLQALAPTPALVLVQTTLQGGNATVLAAAPMLTCTLAVAAAGSPAYAAAALVSLPAGMSLTSALNTNAVGAAQQPLSQGVASFSGVGLKGSGLSAAVPLSASCPWLTGEVLQSQLLLALVPPLLLQWSPATLAAAPLYTLACTAAQGFVTTQPAVLQLVNGATGQVQASAPPVSCTVSIASAVLGATGQATPMALLGAATASTSSGVASFSLGLSGAANASVLLTASCTWISGDTVTVTAPLALRTYALELLWLASGDCACGAAASSRGSDPACASACASSSATPTVLSDTSAIFAAGGAIWLSAGNGANVSRLLPRGLSSFGGAAVADVPSALPSSADVLTLQPLASAPSIVIVRTLADGSSPVALLSPKLPCSIAVDARVSAAAFALGAGNSASGLAFVSAPTSSIVGASSATSSGGRASFSFVGIAGAGFGSAVPLAAQCTWLTTEVVMSATLLARTSRLRARLTVAPPAVALPSSAAQLFLFSPAPAVIIEACLAANCSAAGAFSLFGAVQLACTVHAAPIDPGTGLAATNAAISLQGTLTEATDAATAVASFSRLAAVGPFGAAFAASFACLWSSGDVVAVLAPTTLFPAVSAAWAVGPSNSSFVVGNLSAPPATCLYNTPLTLGVQLTFALPSTPAAPSPPSSTSWTGLTASPGSELSCSLGGTVAGSPILLTGTATAQASASGLVLFVGVALLPALPASATDLPQVVQLSASCLARGNALAAVMAQTTVLLLSVALVQAPPASTLPASVSQPLPFSPAVVVAIINSTGGVLALESSATCTVSIASQAFAPNVPASQQQVSLLGVVRSAVAAGVATFPGLSISGPLGSSASLSFDCARSAGGVVFPVLSTVIIDIVTAIWTPPLIPLWLLYKTPTPISVALRQYVPDPAHGWLATAGSVPPVLSCSLALSNASRSGIAISSSEVGDVTTGTSDANGSVALALSLAGSAGKADSVTALCSIAGQFFSAPPLPVAIETVALVAAVAPPTVWLPSFATALTPFSPVPSVLFVTLHSGAPVDAREAACQVSVASPNAVILAPPVTGYKLALLAQVDGSGGVSSNTTAAAMLGSSTPIALPNVFVQTTAFGLVLNMSISCARSQGDSTAPYSWRLRIVDADVEYILEPPSSVVSQSAFAVALRLVDRGAAAGADGTLPPLALDSETLCTMLVQTNDSLILLQNGVQRAVAGLVSFPGVSLVARSGSVVTGTLSCALGGLAYPRALPWAITMAPCAPGTAPAGVGGYSCVACGSGAYSDGGVGTLACSTCPGQGVSCAGGLLVLLPGFARTQDGALTIDGATELHPCWAAAGCFVNLNASDHNRAASHTHRCLTGYGGPICGVCSAADNFAQASGLCVPCGSNFGNLVVLALIPPLLLAFVVWVSLYRTVEASADSQVLFRILLTYVQTMGTLSSLFVARGTAEFRGIFGFPTAVGDSPLSLTPIQCTLRLSYYVRFLITVSLPFSIAALVLLTNLSALTLARLCRRPGIAAPALPAPPLLPVRLPAAPSASPRALSPAARQLALAAASHPLQRNASRHLRPYAVASVAAVADDEEEAEEQEGPAEPQVHTVGSLLELLREDIVRFFSSQAWAAPVIFVLNASYSSLTTTSFGVFNCLPYSVGGATYLAQDLSVTCFDELHNGFRALAGLLIAFFGAGFPLLFAAVLHRNRAELHTPEVFARFGFLYDGYSRKRRLYYWESVVMVRKAAIVMIGSLIKDAYRQIFASVALLIVSLFLQANFQPYEKKRFNVVECIALVVVMLSQLLCMFYLRSDSLNLECAGQNAVFVVDAQGTTCAQVFASSQTSSVVTTAGLVLINISFMLVMVAAILRTWVIENALAAPPADDLIARGLHRANKRLLESLSAGSGASCIAPRATRRRSGSS